MAWTEYYRHSNGADTLYALPLQSGVWSDAAKVVGSDTNQNTLYVFAGLTDGTNYEVFLQAGINPAEGDTALAGLGNVAGAGMVTIDATGIAAEIASRLAGITVVVNSAIFTGAEGENLEVEQGDHYAGRPVRIDIESETDYVGKYFVLAARLASGGTGGMSLRMLIRSDSEGQFCLFAPGANQTGNWTAGEWALNHRIELAPNEYLTVKRGTLTVRPFDTPATVFEVDPPEE